MEPATPEGAEITVNLGDPELVHALYIAAAGLDTSTDEIVAAAIRAWLAQQGTGVSGDGEQGNK